MNLYLMRHGQAASPEVDPQKGLTADGRLAVEALAQQLVKRGVHFSQVFHSERARAQQTAEIMAQVISPAVVPQQRTDLKPNDDPHLLLAEIDIWQEDTLIASHLPFIPSLLALLSRDQQKMAFEPATVVCLSKADDMNWKIEWFAAP